MAGFKRMKSYQAIHHYIFLPQNNTHEINLCPCVSLQLGGEWVTPKARANRKQRVKKGDDDVNEVLLSEPAADKDVSTEAPKVVSVESATDVKPSIGDYNVPFENPKKQRSKKDKRAKVY